MDRFLYDDMCHMKPFREAVKIKKNRCKTFKKLTNKYVFLESKRQDPKVYRF
jgi:hypothetical protein